MRSNAHKIGEYIVEVSIFHQISNCLKVFVTIENHVKVVTSLSLKWWPYFSRQHTKASMIFDQKSINDHSGFRV
ncbi:hypothetical protein YC2023_028346 [Brassica napus]